MRRVGTVVEGSRFAVGDHVCWVYEDEQSWRQTVGAFLAEGASRDERLLYVARGKPNDLESHLSYLPGWDRMSDSGQLLTRSLDESDLNCDGNAQDQINFIGVIVDEAVCEGFSGVRVAFDASYLVKDGGNLIGSELAVDQSAATLSLTAMCGYNSQIDGGILEELRFVHPLSNRFGPGDACFYARAEGHWSIVGEIDVSNSDLVEECLELLPGDSTIHILGDDLGFVDLSGARALRHSQRSLIVHNAPPSLRKVMEFIGGDRGTSVKLQTP